MDWYQLTLAQCVRVYTSINLTSTPCPIFCPSHLQLGLNQRLQLLLDSIHVAGGCDPGITVDPTLGQRQILGHDTVVDSVNASLLQRLGEGDQLRRAIELSSLGETSGPREDAGNGIG
jgi:hypothetical protein